MSVLGGILGYAIGALLYDSVGGWLNNLYGYGDKVETFRAAYAQWGAWIILLKGLTPIPYKIVTITSGFAGYSFGLFVLFSVITRGARFFVLAFLLHRYGEQADGLKKLKSVSIQIISEITDDPYEVPAGLAKGLISYCNFPLTPEERKAYDYAMVNVTEKGPCCCQCWRWYVYGGLGKYLIKNHGFTDKQIVEVWNLPDGCGGDEEHHH